VSNYTQPSAQRGRWDHLLSLDDFERAAQSVLPRPLYGYIAGAAEDNHSLRGNRSAFERWRLLPRVGRNVSERSLDVELFGRTYSAPFGIAPMGLAALSCFQGDLVMARAAQAAAIPYVLSGSSLTPVEAVVDAAPGSWFQAYLPGDPPRIRALLDRVQACGVEVLVVTLDLPVAGNRENLARVGFTTPLRPSLRLAADVMMRPRWLLGTWLRTLLSQGMPHFENNFAERGAPILARQVLRDFSQRDHLSWAHVRDIRQQWRGPLVLKGLLHPDDVAQARTLGADGVILSNHGGRQLDGAVAPLDMLAAGVEQAQGMTVMLDSGVRRGTDVVKALALGAQAVWLGRPFNFAAAVGGQAAVTRAAAILREELDRDLALLGLCRLAELGPDALVRQSKV
jgi:L-lactate dehydrogenase (cytochrome)